MCRVETDRSWWVCWGASQSMSFWWVLFDPLAGWQARRDRIGWRQGPDAAPRPRTPRSPAPPSESGSAVIPRSWSGGAAKIGKARRGRYLSSQSSAPSFRRRHTLTDSICRVPSAKAKCAGVRLGALLGHRVRCSNSALGAFARSATQTKTSLPPAAAPS